MARYRRKKMFELKFKDDKRALKKLEKAQKKVDKYSKKNDSVYSLKSVILTFSAK